MPGVSWVACRVRCAVRRIVVRLTTSDANDFTLRV